MYKVTRVYEEATATLTNTSSLITTIDVPDVDILVLSIENTGSNAVDSFEIKVNAVGGDHSVLSIKSSEFLTPDFHLLYASSDPSLLAAAGVVILYLNVALLDHIELWGASTSGTTISVLAKGVRQ